MVMKSVFIFALLMVFASGKEGHLRGIYLLNTFNVMYVEIFHCMFARL